MIKDTATGHVLVQHRLAKALNYMRFIEEWGSGLRRVNKVFADYGLRNISLEDAEFAVKMNVYRATKAGDEVVNPDLSSQKRKDDTVNVTVNDIVNDTVQSSGVTINDRLIEAVRKNPGQNADFHARQLGRTRRTVMRYLSKFSGLVEFRGAPKTGGYYCKDERHA
jgi:predicted HTH transcriptional regulator